MKGNKSFVVNRQHYYYSGARVVEIETGGWDCVGPGMLGIRYPELGEGEAFADPREAARAAFDVWREWQDTTSEVIQMSWGSTGGIGTEHDPQDTDEDDNPVYLTPIQVFMLADEAYGKLEKCDQCGDILPADYLTLYGDDFYKYCSEHCAAEADSWNYPDDDDPYTSDPYEGEY